MAIATSQACKTLLVEISITVHFSTMLRDDFAELVERRRLELGLSMADLAERAFGSRTNTVVQDLKRGRSPSIDRAKALCDILGLNFYIGPQRPDSLVTEHANNDDIAFVDLHNVQASAGPGRFAQGAEIVSRLGFPLPWLSRHGVNPDRASLIFVEGDSMFPTIRSGSVALVNHNRHKVRSKRVYAFREEDDLYVKRLEMIEDGVLFVTSDNPDHPSRVIRNHDLEAVSIIGEVVWTSRSW